MSPEVKKFIERNIELLETNAEEFYLTALYILTNRECAELRSCLLDAQIEIPAENIIRFKYFLEHVIILKHTDYLRAGQFLEMICDRFKNKDGIALFIQDILSNKKYLPKYRFYCNNDPAIDPRFKYVVLHKSADITRWIETINEHRTSFGIEYLPNTYQEII